MWVTQVSKHCFMLSNSPRVSAPCWYSAKILSSSSTLHCPDGDVSVAVVLVLAADPAASSRDVVGTAAALLVRCGSGVTNGVVSGVSSHVLFVK